MSIQSHDIDITRPVTGHEGSTLNDAIKIHGDQRDANGGSHHYCIAVFAEIPTMWTHTL